MNGEIVYIPIFEEWLAVRVWTFYVAFLGIEEIETSVIVP